MMLDYYKLAIIRSRRNRNHLHLEKQRVREGEDRRFPCQQCSCWQNHLFGLSIVVMAKIVSMLRLMSKVENQKLKYATSGHVSMR